VPEPTEAELDALMARLSRGDRDAFDPLFRALHPRAARLARVRLPPDRASDAAQAIMLKVFARASEFEAGSPVLPWFYAVSANELRTHERRRARENARATAESGARDVSGPDDPERLVLERELRRLVDQALAALDDTSAQAIASLLDETPPQSPGGPAFRKRVSRAYARLRLLLGGTHGR
jgi:RNA polymerase sigma-70 factor (ECF subfamily)